MKDDDVESTATVVEKANNHEINSRENAIKKLKWIRIKIPFPRNKLFLQRIRKPYLRKFSKLDEFCWKIIFEVFLQA